MTAPTLHVKDYQRRTLPPRHLQLLPLLAEAYFAHEGPMDPAKLAAFAMEVDRAISNASKTLRFGLVLMLDVITWLPLFILGKPATFDTLSLEDRACFLERLERSKRPQLTLIFIAWKTLLTLVYFEEPEQLALVGDPGPKRTRYLSVIQTR